MSSSERRLPLWWDRDVDAKTGHPLRTDVREAAHRVWKWVLRKSDEILGDGNEAAEVLENAVRAVSRYLDNKNIELNSSDPAGLLVLASSRLLRRAANKKRRIELVGSNNELAELLRAPDWRHEIDRRLFLEELAAELDVKNQGILRLRIAGYDWKEIARMLHTSASALRQGLWRDVRKAHLRLLRTGHTTQSDEWK